MLEFTISFTYRNKIYRAGVLRLNALKEIEYNVRPISPDIVRKFGHQIKIFKEEEIYRAYRRIESEHKDLFMCLVKAIKQYELLAQLESSKE